MAICKLVIKTNYLKKGPYSVSEKMGLKDFAWVRHLDTDDRHPHLHVAVCRVNPLTGKTLSDSQSYEKACRFVGRPNENITSSGSIIGCLALFLLASLIVLKFEYGL